MAKTNPQETHQKKTDQTSQNQTPEENKCQVAQQETILQNIPEDNDNANAYAKETVSQDDASQGYIPASPCKRTMAWIALSYVLLFLCLTTYIFYTGTALGNLLHLLLLPGLIGAGALSLVSWRSTGQPGKGMAIFIAIGCWLLAAVTLPLAVMGLLSNFR